jgi:hypothetical protein
MELSKPDVQARVIESDFAALAEAIGTASEIAARLRDVPVFFGANAGILLDSVRNDLESAMQVLARARTEHHRNLGVGRG